MLETEEIMSPPVDSDVEREIGARIRAVRINRVMSQQALAAAVGVSYQSVTKWESGQSRVAASRLLAVSKALGVSVGALVGEDANPKEPAALLLTDE
jgi:transcriptional regulator with XRE-family HTH domain